MSEADALNMLNGVIHEDAEAAAYRERVVTSLLIYAHDYLQFGTFRDMVRLLAEEV